MPFKHPRERHEGRVAWGWGPDGFAGGAGAARAAPGDQMRRVQQITDVTSLPEEVLFQRLQRAADLSPPAAACLSVQLRDPQLPVRELVRLGRELRAFTRRIGAALVVNDRADLALLLEADGVHL